MSQERIKRVQTAMKGAGLDALFVSNLKNVRYLTGLRSTMGESVQPFNDVEYLCLVQADRCNLICDGRYFSGVKGLPGVEPQMLETPSGPKVVGETIRRILGEGKRAVGLERNAVLHSDALGLIDSTAGIEWRPADDLIEKLRLLKTPDECIKLRKAQDVTCDALDHMVGFIKPGMTEHQVAHELDNFLRENSEGCSFASIVAFGETAANAHYTPSANRKLAKGQMILLDFGAIYEGYCGDMTRMLCMGKADARLREVHDLVLTAQQRCLDGVKPGVTTGSLDALCRDFFKQKGCADHFIHGTGHGVGLAIHEDPRLKQDFTTVTQSGMAFSVEPGLYYEGWGGVRIEDLVIVTDKGHENITRASKQLVELAA